MGTNCNLLEIVKKMKSFKIDSATTVRNYLIKKGIRLFYDLNDNLTAYKQAFVDEKLIQAKVPWLKHLNGEKFEISPPETHNFKQWEQWDVIELQPQMHVDLQNPNQAPPNEIDIALVPGYIRHDLCSISSPELNLSDIQMCKSGIKVGSQLRDNNFKWIEKWFDVKCKGQRVHSSK